MTDHKSLKPGVCPRCRGDGYFWRVPDGFNPFSAGGWATSRAMHRVDCYECRSTGRIDKGASAIDNEKTQ